MAQAKNKTVATSASVDAFIDAQGEPRASECRELAAMMEKATGAAPRMWGASMVGFGDWHYRYASGREGDSFEVGFSPRKAALTVYVSAGYEDEQAALAKLGKHNIGNACLYIKSLDDVDRKVLAQILERGVKKLRARHRGA
jgi:hypothetical protein